MVTRSSKLLVAAFWVAAVAAPLVVSAAIAGQVPDAAQVPLHWNASGEVDRWGNSSEFALSLLFTGATLSALNLALLICFVFSGRLYDSGLVHGVSRDGARKVFAVIAVIIVVTSVALLVGAAYKSYSV